MKWLKKGLIYRCTPIDDHISTHAANPLAIHLEGDVFRVFFSGRNNENRSSVSYVDIDIVQAKVVQQPQQTILRYGAEDSFYSHGVSIGNAFFIDKQSFILFMGWQVRGKKHWRGDIGRIKVNSLDSLEVLPKHAFMSVDEEDPISLSYPWVMYDEGIYKMWYGSTVSWASKNGEMIHVIKYATSNDGVAWVKKGLAVPYEIGVAQAFSRPTVLKKDGVYHMWFSYRSGDGTPYRIGYAHSIDGEEWYRHQDSGIDVSHQGWDSEMICYPFVFEHRNEAYMLYNGNNYGSEGFGLAKSCVGL